MAYPNHQVTRKHTSYSAEATDSITALRIPSLPAPFRLSLDGRSPPWPYLQDDPALVSIWHVQTGLFRDIRANDQAVSRWHGVRHEYAPAGLEITLGKGQRTIDRWSVVLLR